MTGKVLKRTIVATGKDLRPVNDIERCADGETFEWRSTGSDPQFMLNTLRWRSGWYLLKMSVNADYPSAQVHVFVGGLRGVRAESRLDLNVFNHREHQRLVFLPPWTKSLRIDPSSQAGAFSFHEFSVERLSNSEAVDHVYRMLANMPEYAVLSPAERQAAVSREAGELQKSYEAYRQERYELALSLQANTDYAAWQVKNEAEDELPSQADLTDRPLLSIVVPVYNTDPYVLSCCVDSVLRQPYENWQLILVDDASSRAETRASLRQLASVDRRVCVVTRTQNGHISVASNDGVAAAEGEWLLLLDHDDCLAAHALTWLVKAINENPEAQFIYSDEDKIDIDGRRYDPHFKADWNPDLLFAQNYICHLAAMKTERVRRIGGFREGFEGSQDHDLFLRYSAGLAPHEVIHISRILYHWRAIEGSTALQSGEKSYAEERGLLAVREAAQAMDANAQVEMADHPNAYHVLWSLPEPPPRVDIIVPTRDRLAILKPCLESVLAHTDYANYHVVVVDNDSREPETLTYLRDLVARDQRVSVLPCPGEFNFSAINNVAVAASTAEYVCLLNNDIEPISKHWLRELVAQANREGVGCVGAKLYYPDERIQHAGVIIGIGGVAGHSHKYFNRYAHGYFGRLKLVQNLSAVTGACLLVRRSIYNEVGGLDAVNLRVAFNDVDFCLRVRDAGYRNVWTPNAELYHHESVSRGFEDSPEKQQRFQGEVLYMLSRWGESLLHDPAYSRHLSLEQENFSLKL